MKKLLYLMYGAACYLVFFPTFLYLIGFISGVGVPKTINDGFPHTLAQALPVNIALIALFVIQHTIMARPAFKDKWTKIVPKPVERSTFVLITSLILILMFNQWRAVPGIVWSFEGSALYAVILSIGFMGWAIVLISTFLIDHFELFGLLQVIRAFTGKEHSAPSFKVRGFYKHVRHPLMSGFLVAFWAVPVMTVGHLVFALVYTLYILAALRIEEKDLVKYHGNDYTDYQKNVPMLFPGLKKRGV